MRRATDLVPLRPAQASRGQQALPPTLSVERDQPSIQNLPPLPKRRQQKSWPTLVSFVVAVALPFLVAVGYYTRIAADIYVSEFRFSVTETTPILPGMSPSQVQNAQKAGTGGAGGLAALFGSFSGGASATQNYLVVDYIMSRQVVEELWEKLDLRGLYGKPTQDFWQRFNPSLPFEQFLPYWQSMVKASYDPVTGLAQVTVRAFSPTDAQRIAMELQTRAEALVNDIAKRAQGDQLTFAEAELRRAEARVKQARAELQAFRLKEGTVDPTTTTLPTNVELAKTVRASLIQQQAELAGLQRQRIDPSSPLISNLIARINSTREQLSKLEGEVMSSRETQQIGSSANVADVVMRFERLDLERQYAQQMMISAQQAYDQARANAAAQHLYLTPYVRPTLPKSPTEPVRWQAILVAGGLFFVIWLIGLMLTRAVRDHAA